MPGVESYTIRSALKAYKLPILTSSMILLLLIGAWSKSNCASKTSLYDLERY